MAVVCVVYAPPDEALAGSVVAAARAGGFDALSVQAGIQARGAEPSAAVLVLWTADSFVDQRAHSAAMQAGNRLINVTRGVSDSPPPFDGRESFSLDGWDLDPDSAVWLRLEDELALEA